MRVKKLKEGRKGQGQEIGWLETRRGETRINRDERTVKVMDREWK